MWGLPTGGKKETSGGGAPRAAGAELTVETGARFFASTNSIT